MNTITSRWYRFLVIGWLCFSCAQPTDYHDESLIARTSQELMANLSQAYNEKDVERYLSTLSKDCLFLHGADTMWGKPRERKIHQNLFASAKNIELKLTEGWSEDATETSRRTGYHFYLQVEFSPERTLEAQGAVVLEMSKTASDHWQINSFRELRSIPQKTALTASRLPFHSDSTDYFPLRVGNKWIYEEILFGMPGYETIVTDSLVLKRNLYYSLRDFVFPFFMQPTFVRVDSLQEFKMFFPADSSELTIFKFNAAVGDTWSFQPPGNLNFPTTVELKARKDSLKVPAGTFKNVLEYLLTINFSTRLLYEFGEKIGMIRQKGANQELVLKNAFINGDVIVSVNTSQYSWMQIKMGF